MNRLLLIAGFFIFTGLLPAFDAGGGETKETEGFGALKSRIESFVKSGRAEDAIALLKKIIREIETASGPKSPDLIIPGEYLAEIYLKKGEYKKAEKLFGLNIELLKSVLGDEHPKVAAYINNMAAFYLDRKELIKAEKLFVRALEIYRKIYGEENEEVVTARANLAELRKMTRAGGKRVKKKEKKRSLGSKKKKAYHTGSFIAYPYRVNGEMLFYDDAGLLNDFERGEAAKILTEIRSRGKTVCFVVILKSLASYGVVGWDADVYAWNLLKKWGGAGEPENRAVLFVSVADHVVSLIGTGKLFEKAKSRLDKIREDVILKDFRAGRFSEGVLRGVRKISDLSE